MIKKLIIACMLGTGIVSCKTNAPAEEKPELATLAYTRYTEKTELFVEFKPLVVGEATNFAAHFTKLGNVFSALEEGTISVSLVVGEKGIRASKDEASSPGIFRLGLKPVVAGKGKLIFDVKTKDYTDQIIIDPVTVYGSIAEAQKVEELEAPADAISFLKEQAWKIEFANERIEPKLFYEVLKVSGQLAAKPSEEQVVTARSNGIVKWNDDVVTGTPVSQGQRLFILTSGNLAQGNIDAQYKEAKVNFEKAEADYKRVQPLLADKIVSEKEYLEIKNRYEQTKIAYETLNRNYSQGGQSVQSPMSGFVKQIMVHSGEFVQAGQALAVITKDQSLQLLAEVPLRYANKLPMIREANFKTLHDDQVYSTAKLNGRVLSYGRAIGDAASLLPIYFSVQNPGTLIPGDAVEVYLKSTPIQNALVVPVRSLIEEQGNFYVYVQVAGESLQKRAVKLGAQDGQQVQILSGIIAGERVITKGAYLVKIASQSGSAPAHGHEH